MAEQLMRRTLAAWLIFFGGLGALIGVDWYLRMRDGEIRTGGFPEPLLVVAQLLLVLGCAWIA
jgi:hypothetical protein